jgi:hypothetical protein
VDVADRHREDELPGKPAKPADDPRREPLATRADYVIAMVDRLEQRIKMSPRPGHGRRGHQDQGRSASLQGPEQGLRATRPRAGDDGALDRSTPLDDQFFERPGHLAGRFRHFLITAQDDDPDGGIG